MNKNTNDDIRNLLSKFDSVDKSVLTEGKTHISPSGVETSMDPSDDDYEINYGKHGTVAKHRKELGQDIRTGEEIDEVEESKTFNDYLGETARQKAAPVTGDVLQLIVNEELAIEMPVVAHDNSSYMVSIDEVAERIISACDRQLDEAYKSDNTPESGKPVNIPDDTWLKIINTNNPQENIVQMKDFRYGYEEVEGQKLKVSKMKNDLIYIESSGGDFAIAEIITPQQAMRLNQGDENLDEAEYQGRDVELNQPMRGDVKKYKVFVKDPKTGNVKKVNFGDKNMEIKRDNPEARKSFRARHKCSEKSFEKDRTSAGYWSCKFWSSTPVSELLK